MRLDALLPLCGKHDDIPHVRVKLLLRRQSVFGCGVCDSVEPHADEGVAVRFDMGQRPLPSRTAKRDLFGQWR